MLDPTQITIIGGARVDHVVTSKGACGGPSPGGNAFYAAAAARLWGYSNIHVVTRLMEPWEDRWTERVSRAGIQLHALKLVGDEGQIETFFQYDDEGNRTDIAPYDWARYAGVEYPSQKLLRRQTLDPESAHVAVTPFGTDVPSGLWCSPVVALMTAPLENQLSWGRALRDADCHEASRLVLLDPYITYMASATDAELQKLLRAASVFLPSEAELRMRYGSLDLSAAADALQELGSQSVIVKEGRKGATIYTEGRRVEIPTYPASAPDPTGAGDAFAGGLAVGWLETHDLPAAALYGAVSASFMVQDFGFLHTLEIERGDALRRLRDLRAATKQGNA